jgi:hypothetical protein
MVKESDNEVNNSHWNTAKMRQTSQNIIESMLPIRRHWVPQGSKFDVQNEDLDFVPFCVGVEVNAYDLQICCILVINQPPVNKPLPASISVLATEEG